VLALNLHLNYIKYLQYILIELKLWLKVSQLMRYYVLMIELANDGFEEL
jgi:hypothetical protein